jgi:hypothetical protein
VEKEGYETHISGGGLRRVNSNQKPQKIVIPFRETLAEVLRG